MANRRTRKPIALSHGVKDAPTSKAIRQLEGIARDLQAQLDAVPASGDSGGGVTLPINEGDVTGLVTDLAAKASAARTIGTTAPLTGGGDLSADRTLGVSQFSASSAGVVPASGGGTSDFLRADGVWAVPPRSGCYLGQIVVAASGNITLAANCATIRVRMVGGGGGGGGSGGGWASGAGGNSGVYWEKDIAVTGGAVVSCTVGAGGGGGTGGGNGSSGGMTSFTVGGSTYRADGGGGGNGVASISTAHVTRSALLNQANTSAASVIRQERGCRGIAVSTGWYEPGDGAGGVLGSGGQGGALLNAGTAGTGYGSGGGGGKSGSQGGNGAAGVIIIDQYT